VTTTKHPCADNDEPDVTATWYED